MDSSTAGRGCGLMQYLRADANDTFNERAMMGSMEISAWSGCGLLKVGDQPWQRRFFSYSGRQVLMACKSIQHQDEPLNVINTKALEINREPLIRCDDDNYKDIVPIRIGPPQEKTLLYSQNEQIDNQLATAGWKRDPRLATTAYIVCMCERDIEMCEEAMMATHTDHKLWLRSNHPTQQLYNAKDIVARVAAGCDVASEIEGRIRLLKQQDQRPDVQLKIQQLSEDLGIARYAAEHPHAPYPPQFQAMERAAHLADLRQRYCADKPLPSRIGRELDNALIGDGLSVEEFLLGEGNFGKVLLGQLRNDAGVVEVAVKVPRQPIINLADDAIRGLIREINTLRSCRHPNIVAYHGLTLRDNSLCLVMERVIGKNYSVLLMEYEVPISVRAGIIDGIAEGMEYLHVVRRIIHRDLKCANILISMPGCVPKICDFGMASTPVPDDRSANYTVSNYYGTPVVAAPELPNSTHTFAVDVFSFAYIMWQSWSRREPFESVVCSVDQHFTNVGNGMREKIDPECPWNDLIIACWDTDPEKRPTFTDFRARFRPWSALAP